MPRVILRASHRPIRWKCRHNLLLWTAIVAVAPWAPAHAADLAVSSAETGGIALSSGDSLVVTSEGSLSTGADKAVSLKSATAIDITVESGGEIVSDDDGIKGKSAAGDTGTIMITNNGVIKSTGSGQAIDFDDVAFAGITTTIINGPNGKLIAVNADGIRPGAGATVINSGEIHAGGPAGDSHDGVDFQGKSGTVINQAGGLISGQRHGITSDLYVDITNEAGATIIGRNGSGVGSDGDGRVINYGTIIGAHDGSDTGDGDGIDIDGAFYVENHGLIQATGAAGFDKHGDANAAEGVALGGGGVLINEKGATITSVGGGAAICCSTNLATFTNHGTISGDQYGGVAVGGYTAGYNYGDILSNNMALLVDSGSIKSSIVNFGVINGGLYGAYILSADPYIIDNHGSISSSNTAIMIFPGATLDLTMEPGSSISGAIRNEGQLNLTNTEDYRLASAFSGAGGLTKSGAGRLDLTGDGTFSGPTVVAAGALSVNGSLGNSKVTVMGGARLGGNGAVGDIVARSGATVAPGNSIGTLHVAGGVAFEAGSVYEVETSAIGGADKIIATGAATIRGGAVRVLSNLGNYAPSTPYVILAADGGVAGRFDEVIGQYAFLMPSLAYDANSVTLTLTRNAVGFADIGVTSNQRAVGAGIESLPWTNAVWSAALGLDEGTAREAFDQLSGEIHASVRTGLFDDSRLSREAVLDRLLEQNAGQGLWIQAAGDWGGADGNGNASRLRRRASGMIGGADAKLGVATIGLAGGYINSKLINALANRADLKSWHLLGYAGATLGNVAVRMGLGYAQADIATRRAIDFTGFSDTLHGGGKGSTVQGFGEIGYQIVVRGGVLEPFAGMTMVRTHGSGLTEQGGAAALTIDGASDSFTSSNLGLKVKVGIAGPLFANASLGWRHLFGNGTPVSTLRLADSHAFSIAGTSASKDAGTFSLAAGWRLGHGATLGARYSGAIGARSDTSVASLALGMRF